MTTNAGHILKLLNTIVLPFRTSSNLPYLDEDLQNTFIPRIVMQMESLYHVRTEHAKVDGERREQPKSSLTGPIIFLARLLQFDLGFPGAWTAVMRSSGQRLLEVVFRLSLVSYISLHIICHRLIYSDSFTVVNWKPIPLFSHCCWILLSMSLTVSFIYIDCTL